MKIRPFLWLLFLPGLLLVLTVCVSPEQLTVDPAAVTASTPTIFSLTGAKITLSPVLQQPASPPLTPTPARSTATIFQYLDDLEARLAEIEAEFELSGNAINSQVSHLALLAQAWRWRQPELDREQALEWRIAHYLAIAGDQRATDHLLPLVRQNLPDNLSAPWPNLATLNADGFRFIWLPVPDLIMPGAQAWVLTVNKKPTQGGGGAVLVVSPDTTGAYGVTPLLSAWQSAFTGDLETQAGEHTAGGRPELLFRMDEQHGMGFDSRESWLCGYTWQVDRWATLFNGLSADLPDSKVGLPNGCLVYTGGISELEFVPRDGGQPDWLRLSKLVSPYQCGGWEIHQTFTWVEDHYERDTEITLGFIDNNLNNFYCLSKVGRYAGETTDHTELIALLERMLSFWPEIEGQARSKYGENANYSEAELRFRLARLYALSGETQRAQEILVDIQASPATESALIWQAAAGRYLAQLDNPQQAEQDFLSNSYSSNDETSPAEKTLGEVAAHYAEQLFIGQASPALLVTELQAALVNPDLPTQFDGSSVVPVANFPSIIWMEANDCAALQYVLGLAYEADGQPSQADIVFRELLSAYPDSIYAWALELGEGEPGR